MYNPIFPKFTKDIFMIKFSSFFNSLLSKDQCVLRRGYSAQHRLISLIEKCKKSVDNGDAFGALLTDVSKAFDCLHHEVFISKLHTLESRIIVPPPSPLPIVNFSIFFHPGHLYSNPTPIINFQSFLLTFLSK